MRVNARVPQEYNRINLEPISGALGAIVHGVDMRELDDEIITELHQAWMDHKVLFFRNQELTSAQHVEYGKAFGELEIHPFTSNLEEQPEIIVLESTPENIVAAELAERVEIQTAYAIGYPQPTSITIDCFGTEKVSEESIERAILQVFSFKPADIVSQLDLLRPIYRETTHYGHFGKSELPWEQTNKIESLKNAIT